MFVKAMCKKCNCEGVLDIGTYSKEETEVLLKKRDFGECAFGGWHVEIGKMADYITPDWTSLTDSKDNIILNN